MYQEKLCYKVGDGGIYATDIELTSEEVWSYISFNLRLSYNECLNCIRYIESIGGEGGITVGGSYYIGNVEMIEKLIIYMTKNNYDLDSLSFDHPNEATKRKIEGLKHKLKN